MIVVVGSNIFPVDVDGARDNYPRLVRSVSLSRVDRTVAVDGIDARFSRPNRCASRKGQGECGFSRFRSFLWPVRDRASCRVSIQAEGLLEVGWAAELEAFERGKLRRRLSLGWPERGVNFASWTGKLSGKDGGGQTGVSATYFVAIVTLEIWPVNLLSPGS